MRWKTGRRSENIEDRRGRGGGLGIPMRVGRKGGFSIGTLVIAAVVMYFLGIDPTILLTGGSGGLPGGLPGGLEMPQPRAPGAGTRGDVAIEQGTEADFVSVVLADTEDTWKALFNDLGRRYKEPRLVLFSGLDQSGCGMAQAAMGPFYCPLDQTVYIDLDFYDEMRRRFGTDGDFAQAYVIAHEVGHHVQTLLGISEKVVKARNRMSESDGNRLSVMQELQADCFAGVWANHAQKARNILEQGDLEEALNAATAIGDDRIQRKTQGHVVPDAFTHGTSEQRARWFRTGVSEGQLDACDTFSAERL